jgi:hypothetical protein
MTTNLPATFADGIEIEARALAREWVARAQTGDFIGLGCAPAHPEAGQRFVRRLMAMGANESSFMFALVEFALAGWSDAIAVVDGLISEHVNYFQPLPAFLAYYDQKIRAGHRAQRPRGPKRTNNFMLEILVVTLVMEMLTLGFKEYRYQLGRKRRPSACSIVAEALTEAGLHRGGERAVMEIWRRHKPKVLPGWQKAPPHLLQNQ